MKINEVSLVIERLKNLRQLMKEKSEGFNLASETGFFVVEKVPLYKSLLNEYVRRMNLWADIYQINEESLPFFDLSNYVAPQFKLDENTIREFELIMGKNQPIRSYFPQIYFWYIKWKAMENQAIVIEKNLLEPYEPMIQFFEEGGTFYIEQSQVYGGDNRTIGYLKNWRDK